MARENLLKLRRGTAQEWAAVNPTLDAGEPGFESDTKLFKIGDGSTSWNNLKYVGVDGGNLDASPVTTPTASATPTPTASVTPTPTASATPTPTASATPTPTASATPTPTASATPVPPTPTASATPTPTPTTPANQNPAFTSTRLYPQGSWSGSGVSNDPLVPSDRFGNNSSTRTSLTVGRSGVLRITGRVLNNDWFYIFKDGPSTTPIIMDTSHSSLNISVNVVVGEIIGFVADTTSYDTNIRVWIENNT